MPVRINENKNLIYPVFTTARENGKIETYMSSICHSYKEARDKLSDAMKNNVFEEFGGTPMITDDCIRSSADYSEPEWLELCITPMPETVFKAYLANTF